jgi:hypothetical protein
VDPVLDPVFFRKSGSRKSNPVPLDFTKEFLPLHHRITMEPHNYHNAGLYPSFGLESGSGSIIGTQFSRFHLRTETESGFRKSVFEITDRRWIMSRIAIVILIYRRHKPTDSMNLLGS